MIVLYAITDRAPLGTPFVAGRGLGDETLRTLDFGALAGVYSRCPAGGVEPTAEALWRHEEVLETLMAERAVLPIRFGSLLDGRPALRDLLRSRADEFAAALDFVRGRVEMGVRARLGRTAGTDGAAAPADSAAAPAGSGRAYLAAKLEHRRAAAALAEELNAELDALARASTFRALDEPVPELAAAYLVDRAAAADFQRRAAELGARRPEVELVCTGPWPPFSFTEEPS